MWGGCHAADVPGFLWNLNVLPELKQTHQEWLDGCFLDWLRDDPNDPSARPWLDKLPFVQVGDGDMIAIDLAEGAGHGQVVYLCHDDACRIHGQVLGADFEDFVTRWSRIGMRRPRGFGRSTCSSKPASSRRQIRRLCRSGDRGSAWQMSD